MSFPSAGSQGNSLWPYQGTQQPGVQEWPGQPYQPCWPNQPNQANLPGMQPNIYWPANQPTPTTQPGWPSFPTTQPSQPNLPMPPSQPNQQDQPYQPMPPSQPISPFHPNQPMSPYQSNQPMPPTQPISPYQSNQPMPPSQPSSPYQPNQPMPPSQPISPYQSNQPMPPSQPISPYQPNQPMPPSQPISPSQPNQSTPPSWPSQLPNPTRPAWHGNPGQSGWPGQNPAGGQKQPWPPVPSTGPLSVPFNMNFPRGIYDKLMLTIRGHVKPGAKMFTVNFLRGNDIAFHINPRFNEGGKQVLVRNHMLGEQWGPEERNLNAPFPFAAGQNFEMKILCTISEFKVAVNNMPLFDFKHRIKEVNQIDRLNILHDINLESVNVDTLP